MVEPERTSPIANTRDRLVCSGSGAGACAAAERQPGQDVAVLIEREASIEPCRIWFGADEHEDLTGREVRRRAEVPVANGHAFQGAGAIAQELDISDRTWISTFSSDLIRSIR